MMILVVHSSARCCSHPPTALGTAGRWFESSCPDQTPLNLLRFSSAILTRGARDVPPPSQESHLRARSFWCGEPAPGSRPKTKSDAPDWPEAPESGAVKSGEGMSAKVKET